MHSPSKTILSLFVLLNLSLPVLSAGTQFITGACTSDADCAGNCCGFNSGKCAGAIVALQRDGGCGFGDATPNDNAAKALGFTGGITSASTGSGAAGAAAAASPSASANPAKAAAASAASAAPAAGAGKQFITGACTSDADCAAGCCGFNSGKCAGPVVAQERDGGCGFGDAQPNDNAAQKLKGQRRGMAWERNM
ncbi:Uncharacterized protein BP5553_03068 [Venustampulla echinocandica]|uniref:Biotrophy-associated secreted protein 2 n=1 Tax=Venustampulla echinocandica TaxID=2656787 RepID=A0A370TTB4_9HELO|nr:Uncharacterized protein BP5553_03068 [Venustampulla echinocandica]RDL38728.1 Uncharacterized protein BP5553_03068 [Venustampulla echinocandica]